jgi:hypothetical protein
MPALINARSGQRIASAVEIAVTRSARRRGLLGRASLDPSSGMLLAPCSMIHTAFMQFPIDVIFVNRAGQVTRIVRRLGAWRAAASLRASATIELAAGALDACDVVPGDRLYFEEFVGFEGFAGAAGLAFR